MQSYTLFRVDSGLIVGSGSSFDIDTVEVPEGCGIYVGDKLSHRDAYFFEGLPRNYTDEERERQQARPGHAARWDTAAMAWVDLRDLAQTRDDKWIEIKRARELALLSPLITPLGVFDADEKGSASILKSVVLANNLVALGYPVAIDFTLADNTVAVLGAPAMVQVGLMLAWREQAVRAQANALRSQIAGASLETLETIAWTDL